MQCPVLEGEKRTDIAAGFDLLKVHNIAFSTTAGDVERWMPEEILAPLKDSAQSIHILSDPYQRGKTLPYVYIECMSTEAVKRLVRERSNTRLNGKAVSFSPAKPEYLYMDLFPALRERRNGGLSLQVVPSARSSAMTESASPTVSPATEDLFSAEDQAALEHLMDLVIQDHQQQQAPGSGAAPPGLVRKPAHLSALSFIVPAERPFYRLSSIITKFPWSTPYWTKEVENRLFQSLLSEWEAYACILSSCDFRLSLSVILHVWCGEAIVLMPAPSGIHSIASHRHLPHRRSRQSVQADERCCFRKRHLCRHGASGSELSW